MPSIKRRRVIFIVRIGYLNFIHRTVMNSRGGYSERHRQYHLHKTNIAVVFLVGSRQNSVTYFKESLPVLVFNNVTAFFNPWPEAKWG